MVGRECEQAEHQMAGDFRGSPHPDMTGAELVLEPGPLDDRADAISESSGVGIAGSAPGLRGSGLA